MYKARRLYSNYRYNTIQPTTSVHKIEPPMKYNENNIAILKINDLKTILNSKLIYVNQIININFNRPNQQYEQYHNFFLDLS